MKAFRQVISPKHMQFLRLILFWKQPHDIDIHPSANQFLKQRPVLNPVKTFSGIHKTYKHRASHA